jgi:hypothetical protein
MHRQANQTFILRPLDDVKPQESRESEAFAFEFIDSSECRPVNRAIHNHHKLRFADWEPLEQGLLFEGSFHQKLADQYLKSVNPDEVN